MLVSPTTTTLRDRLRKRHWPKVTQPVFKPKAGLELPSPDDWPKVTQLAFMHKGRTRTPITQPDFMLKAGLEFNVSWFLAWCLNPLYTRLVGFPPTKKVDKAGSKRRMKYPLSHPSLPRLLEISDGETQFGKVKPGRTCGGGGRERKGQREREERERERKRKREGGRQGERERGRKGEREREREKKGTERGRERGKRGREGEREKKEKGENEREGRKGERERRKSERGRGGKREKEREGKGEKRERERGWMDGERERKRERGKGGKREGGREREKKRESAHSFTTQHSNLACPLWGPTPHNQTCFPLNPDPHPTLLFRRRRRLMRPSPPLANLSPSFLPASPCAPCALSPVSSPLMVLLAA
ncbi:Zinc finger CCCH domain-containing protein 13, partial [Ophiophagus hannah]